MSRNHWWWYVYVPEFLWGHFVWHSSLQGLKDIVDDEEARKRGFPRGGSFKLLQHDVVLLTEDQSATMRAGIEEERHMITQDHKKYWLSWTWYNIIIMYFRYWVLSYLFSLLLCVEYSVQQTFATFPQWRGIKSGRFRRT